MVQPVRTVDTLSRKYSVMQSDKNSFFGDVVVNSFYMAYIDDYSILDKKYEKKIFWNLYHRGF